MESMIYDLEKIQDILNEIRICTALCFTINGKIYSQKAEEYIKWIKKFSKYCIPEMVDEWEKSVRKIIYGVIVPKPKTADTPQVKEMILDNDYEIIDNLYNFMNAAEIMEIYDKTESWEEVYKVIKNQGHTGYTFSGLSNVMIQFSLIGTNFIEKFDPNRIVCDREFKKYYDKAKTYKNERQELNKRLVFALAKKHK